MYRDDPRVIEYLPIKANRLKKRDTKPPAYISVCLSDGNGVSKLGLLSPAIVNRLSVTLTPTVHRNMAAEPPKEATHVSATLFLDFFLPLYPFRTSNGHPGNLQLAA